MLITSPTLNRLTGSHWHWHNQCKTRETNWRNFASKIIDDHSTSPAWKRIPRSEMISHVQPNNQSTSTLATQFQWQSLSSRARKPAVPLFDGRRPPAVVRRSPCLLCFQNVSNHMVGSTISMYDCMTWIDMTHTISCRTSIGNDMRWHDMTFVTSTAQLRSTCTSHIFSPAKLWTANLGWPLCSLDLNYPNATLQGAWRKHPKAMPESQGMA